MAEAEKKVEGGNKNAESSIVDWNVMPNCKTRKQVEGLGYDEGLEIIKHVEGTPEVIDEEVDQVLAAKLLADIRSTFSAAKPWSDGKKICEDKDGSFDGHEWLAADGCSRMQTWISKEFDTEVFLYSVGKFGLMIGSLQSHPIIRCSSFVYLNSDGSHEAEIPAGSHVTAEELLEWLCREAKENCQDIHH